MLAVVHPSDLANILRTHPKMQELELARTPMPPLEAPAACTAIVDSRGMIRIPASTLQTLPGFGDLDPKIFEGKTMRQMGRGKVDDEGNDISGYFVVADGGAAVIFHDPNVASRWANNKNQVNIEIAPSLTYVDSGNSQVTLLILGYI